MVHINMNDSSSQRKGEDRQGVSTRRAKLRADNSQPDLGRPSICLDHALSALAINSFLEAHRKFAEASFTNQSLLEAEPIQAKDTGQMPKLGKQTQKSATSEHSRSHSIKEGSDSEQSTPAAKLGYSSFQSEQEVPSQQLKPKSAELSKESLEWLETHLQQKHPSEELLELTAKWLSQVSLEAKLPSVLRLLGGVKEATMQSLVVKLRDLASEEYLVHLLSRIAADLPDQSLCVAKVLLLDPLTERGFVEAFRVFIELLSQGLLSVGVIGLAEEVSERLSSSQIGHLNSALSTLAKEQGVESRLDEMRLKEAYLRLREGDAETAEALVRTLMSNPLLEAEVKNFYEWAGLAKLPKFGHDKEAQDATESNEAEDIESTSLQDQPELAEAEIWTLRAEVKALKCQIARSKRQLREREEAYLLTKISYDLRLAIPSPHKPKVKEPAYIYSFQENTSQLYRTHLASGKESYYDVLDCKFKAGCALSQLAGGSLLVTGGGLGGSSKAKLIDVKSFTVFKQPDMLTAREHHCAVPHSKHLYVLGGMLIQTPLKECERYVCPESRWEALPALPTACSSMSGIEFEGSLYALGGSVGWSAYLDLIQRLRLEDLTWEVMQVRLPYAGFCICFAIAPQVYFVMKRTLYSFHPQSLEVQQCKVLSTLQHANSSGLCYYVDGTLHYSSGSGAAHSLKVGSLS
jgi:hypothetical protein